MSHAYRNWLNQSRVGDKLPRGKFFKRRQLAMDSLAHELFGAHELTYEHLGDAFSHYLDITGSDPYRNYHITHPDDLEQDKITYASLIKKNVAGNALFNTEDCARFMHTVWQHSYASSIAFARLYSPLSS